MKYYLSIASPLTSLATIVKIPRSADRIKSPQECHHQFPLKKNKKISKLVLTKLKGMGVLTRAAAVAPTDRRGAACATELVAAPAAVVVDRRPPRAEMLLAAIADAAISMLRCG